MEFNQQGSGLGVLKPIVDPKEAAAKLVGAFAAISLAQRQQDRQGEVLEHTRAQTLLLYLIADGVSKTPLRTR